MDHIDQKTATRISKAERRRMTIDVYDSDYTSVYLGVPRDRTCHVPQREKADRGKPLLQCAIFEASRACPKESACPFVHADLSGLQPQRIHVNYAWRSVTDIPYEIMPAAEGLPEAIEVLAPNNRPPLQLVQRQAILSTRGSQAAAPGQVLSQCAHFYFNLMCNRGERCLYVHVAHVDPAATAKQLAPTPAAIGPNETDDAAPSNRTSQPCSPGMSRAQSVTASPCCRFQPGFTATFGPLSPALNASPMHNRYSIASPMDDGDNCRPASAISLPMSSAPPSAPTSGNYNDMDLAAFLAQCPSDLDVSVSATPKPAKCLEKVDHARSRVVYFEPVTMTSSQFRHNPYSHW